MVLPLRCVSGLPFAAFRLAATLLAGLYPFGLGQVLLLPFYLLTCLLHLAVLLLLLLP